VKPQNLYELSQSLGIALPESLYFTLEAQFISRKQHQFCIPVHTIREKPNANEDHYASARRTLFYKEIPQVIYRSSGATFISN
jgi:hypothetical protein